MSGPGTSSDHTIRTTIVQDIDPSVVQAFGHKTFEEALNALVAHCRLMVEAHQAALSYIPDGDFRVAVHALSMSKKYEKYNTYDVMPTGDGIWAIVVRQKLSVCMTNDELTSHPGWKNFSDMKDARGLEHPPMRGWLAVPILRRDGGCVGLLQATDKFTGDFTDDDLTTFAHLAAMIAPTFELQYVNQQMQRHTLELQEKTEELSTQRQAALNLAEEADQARRRAEKAEQRLTKQTKQLKTANESLEQSNLELQQFAYVASHDLQTPLRSISGFTQLLAAEYKDKLDAQAGDWIQRVVEGVDRMQLLIDDLLSYSRVENRSRPFESVCFCDVVNDAVHLLDASIRDASAQVTHGELPTVLGDRAQLVQLLQNLIGNGIKYRSDDPPRVHVSANSNEDGEWEFCVRDNGIGIDQKHHARIFEIFKRLHTQQAYPGTGIGLAICRRVVQRHGGEIWLESKIGEGSRFLFTIPQK